MMLSIAGEDVELPVRIIIDPYVEAFCRAYKLWIASQYDYNMMNAEKDHLWLNYCMARDTMLCRKIVWLA